MAGSTGRLVRIAKRIPQETAAQARRGRLWLWQRRHLDAGEPRRPVFVVGCQRSGTNMVMWTLEQAPACWVWHEHLWSVAFRDYRLRGTRRIDRLIAASAAPVVVFKPVCDSHLTDRLLERHEGARAVWIFRRYPDVANSARRNWGTHMVDMARWIAAGDTDWLGWRGERLDDEAVGFVRELEPDRLSIEEGAALFWWLRNRFFFELGLDADPRVLLVRYEDLVSGDPRHFERIFDFVGIPFDPAYLEGLSASSVGKHAFPSIDPRLRDRCDALLARLEEAHAKAAPRAGAEATTG